MKKPQGTPRNASRAPLLLTTQASHKPLYAALGLPETATSVQIHEAFLRIARAHHPDVNGDPLIFSAAMRAHDTLMDPGKRKVYDETGLDPDSPEDATAIQALTLIRQIVLGILNDGNVDIDLIARIRTVISNEHASAQTFLRQVRNKAEKAEKMLSNIEKRWKKGDRAKGAVRGIVSEQLEAARNEAVPIEAAIKVAVEALRIIEECEYEAVVKEAVVITPGAYGRATFGSYIGGMKL